MSLISRRHALIGAAGLALPGCEPLNASPGFQSVLASAERFTEASQRALFRGLGQPLAREYTLADLSPSHKANGTISPDTPGYLRLLESGFADWRLTVRGLVARPLSLSLAQLRALPARTQITRHDCVEGWSAIGQWSGPQLGGVLRAAGIRPEARYVVFRCADELERRADGLGRYYESCAVEDAFHPQTILAHSLNGQPLPVRHGAPLRLRLERQLGYKMAKYLMRIEVTDTLAGIGGGKGGFWPDRNYEWYAGI